MYIKFWEAKMNVGQKKIFALALFMFFMGGTAIAEVSAPIVEWSRTFDGSGMEWGSAIQQTDDGGYIFAGSIADPSGNRGSNALIIRLNAAGDVVWQRSFGGAGTDIINAIRQTRDGGYIFAGSSSSSDGYFSCNRGDWDGWIVKLDSSGEIDWKRMLGGSGADHFNAVYASTAGGYIAVGSSASSDGDVPGERAYSDGWIVKLDNNGDVEWQKLLGGSGRDSFHSIQQTADSGYVVTGTSSSSDEADLWIVRLKPEPQN